MTKLNHEKHFSQTATYIPDIHADIYNLNDDLAISVCYIFKAAFGKYSSLVSIFLLGNSTKLLLTQKQTVLYTIHTACSTSQHCYRE